MISTVGFENHIGKITISENYITEIARHAVMECFGVSGVSGVNTFYRAMSAITFGRAFRSKNGVSVRTGRNGGLVIDLHIKVSYGTNITAAVSSIIHNVSFKVEEAAGVPVQKVNVFVDDMTV